MAEAIVCEASRTGERTPRKDVDSVSGRSGRVEVVVQGNNRCASFVKATLYVLYCTCFPKLTLALTATGEGRSWLLVQSFVQVFCKLQGSWIECACRRTPRTHRMSQFKCKSESELYVIDLGVILSILNGWRSSSSVLIGAHCWFSLILACDSLVVVLIQSVTLLLDSCHTSFFNFGKVRVDNLLRTTYSSISPPLLAIFSILRLCVP